ncbi:type VII secretion system-associated protein [Streptomyces sp. CA-288835]|uniref:type VII secretion system-associated protein n=1 Tax=Streptomyces sp. CA-288835 TaxID=3240069 RepID=UPI003D8ABEF3
MADVTVLDSEFIKKFTTEQIEVFAATLGAIAQDHATEGPAMKSISAGIENTTISSTTPLILGEMAKEQSSSGGGELNAVVRKAAEELARIFEDHGVLFEDVQEAMWDTVDKLNEAQGKGLETIAMEEFMDIFEDVDSDLSGESEDEDEES